MRKIIDLSNRMISSEFEKVILFTGTGMKGVVDELKDFNFIVREEFEGSIDNVCISEYFKDTVSTVLRVRMEGKHKGVVIYDSCIDIGMALYFKPFKRVVYPTNVTEGFAAFCGYLMLLEYSQSADCARIIKNKFKEYLETISLKFRNFIDVKTEIVYTVGDIKKHNVMVCGDISECDALESFSQAAKLYCEAEEARRDHMKLAQDRDALFKKDKY